jgi:hypothetical protein
MTTTAITFYIGDQQQRDEAQEAYPDFSDAQIREHLEEQWEELDDEDRAPYEALVIAASKKKKPIKKKSPKKKAPKKSPKASLETRPKKACNAYFHFMQHHRESGEHEETGAALTKVLSALWRKLTPEEKEPWEEESEREKEELLQNPIMIPTKKRSTSRSPSSESKKIKALEKELRLLKQRVTALEPSQSDSEDSDSDSD